MGLQALSHFSGYMFADIEVERRSACYCVAADKASGNAVFITLQEGEIRWCLAVALPATADLIKANRQIGSVWKKEREKKCQCCASLAFSVSHLTSTLTEASFMLRVSAHSPWCFVSVFSLLPLFLSFLTCSDDVRTWSSRAPLFSPTILHRHEASLISQALQLPQGPQESLLSFPYSASFSVLVPRLSRGCIIFFFYLISVYWHSPSLSRFFALPDSCPQLQPSENCFDVLQENRSLSLNRENVWLKCESF